MSTWMTDSIPTSERFQAISRRVAKQGSRVDLRKSGPWNFQFVIHWFLKG